MRKSQPAFMTFLHRLIPALGRRKALRIARAHCSPALADFSHHDALDVRLSFYAKPKEPCWIISAPWQDGKDGSLLRSYRIIMISKRTGRILYDGSASDEG